MTDDSADTTANADGDGEDDHDTSDLKSPISGVDSAMGAGTAGMALLDFARSLKGKRVRGHVRKELPAYLCVQSSWFMAFGLQMVLFPYLITSPTFLNLDGTELGLANMALSAPSVVFLLLGGVVAERADGKRLLMMLHLLAAVPAFGLAAAVMTGSLTYTLMIVYGLAIGTVGAFMMPARDAIVNEVVERRMRTGSGMNLQLGVTLATMAQFVSQIVGLILAGYASKATTMPSWLGGFAVPQVKPGTLLMIQGGALACGAVFALLLAKGRKVRTGRKGIGAAFGDIAEGFATVRADPRLWSMTVLMFGVGVFVIGSFLVVLPIVNRDVYGLNSDGIRDMFVTFWLGAFVSSVALAVFKNIKRQGRLLLIAQLFGSLAILFLLIPDFPHYAFLMIVFVWGLAGGVSIAMSRSIVQEAAPKNQLARVLSIYQLGFMAGAPLGAAVMGYLTDVFATNFRVEYIAIIPATGMTVLILWMALGTPVWNMKSATHLAREDAARMAKTG